MYNNSKKKKSKFIRLLGTGRPIREFIYSDDLAEAIIRCLNVPYRKLRKKFMPVPMVLI